MFSGMFEPCEMLGPCRRCLLYKPDQLLRVVPGRCAHSQTHRAALSRIPQTPVRHDHAKAGRHEGSSALHPQRADLAKVSGLLVGHASLNSSSYRPPSRPLLLNRPLQLSPRGQLKCLLELVSDSNHSSIQSPPPNTPQFCQHCTSFQTPVLLLHYPLNQQQTS